MTSGSPLMPLAAQGEAALDAEAHSAAHAIAHSTPPGGAGRRALPGSMRPSPVQTSPRPSSPKRSSSNRLASPKQSPSPKRSPSPRSSQGAASPKRSKSPGKGGKKTPSPGRRRRSLQIRTQEDEMQALAELKALNASPMKDELRGVSDFEIEPSPVHATLDRFQSEQRQAATGSGADGHSHVRQLRFSSDAAVMDAAVSSASNQGRNRVLKANGLQGVDIYDIHNLEPDDERPHDPRAAAERSADLRSRSRRLSMALAADAPPMSSAAKQVQRKLQETNARRRAKEEMLMRRANRPMPTDLSDIGHVIAWVEKHRDEIDAAGAKAPPTSDEPPSPDFHSPAFWASSDDDDDPAEGAWRGDKRRTDNRQISFKELVQEKKQNSRGGKASGGGEGGEQAEPKPKESRFLAVLEAELRADGALPAAPLNVWQRQMKSIAESHTEYAAVQRAKAARREGDALAAVADAARAERPDDDRRHMPGERSLLAPQDRSLEAAAQQRARRSVGIEAAIAAAKREGASSSSAKAEAEAAIAKAESAERIAQAAHDASSGRAVRTVASVWAQQVPYLEAEKKRAKKACQTAHDELQESVKRSRGRYQKVTKLDRELDEPFQEALAWYIHVSESLEGATRLIDWGH